MLMLLVLASHVAGEWVEIAQYHHRKLPSRRMDANYEEITRTNKIYANYSIIEHLRNRDIATTFPNLGIVDRVRLPSRTIDYVTAGTISERIPSSDQTNVNRQRNYFNSVREPNTRRAENLGTENTTRESQEYSQLTDEVDWESNIRSQTTSLHFSGSEKNISYVRPPNFLQDKRRETIKEDKYPVSKPSNNRKQERTIAVNKNNLKYSETKISQSIANVDRVQEVKETKVKNENNSVKISDSKGNLNIDKNNINKDTKNEKTTKKSTLEADDEESQQFLDQDNLNNNDQENSDIRSPNRNGTNLNRPYIDEEKNKHKTTENATIILEKNYVDHSDKGDNQSHRDTVPHEDDHLSTSSKGNTVEVIWKFMKLVSDNISRNTRRSFRSKMTYLENLRNNILGNIEERIEQAWPDVERAGGPRTRRAARGHVEFPSSESALMTISFLTFAVFLIKLVLQVIQTYKNKTMMVTPAVVAAVGRAAVHLNPQTPS